MTSSPSFAEDPSTRRAPAAHSLEDSAIRVDTGDTWPDGGQPADGGEWADWGSDGEGAFAQGDYELEERYALRRVAGISTELADVSEVEYRKLRLERVVLVGVWSDGTEQDADNSLAELKLLAETAGSVVL